MIPTSIDCAMGVAEPDAPAPELSTGESFENMFDYLQGVLLKVQLLVDIPCADTPCSWALTVAIRSHRTGVLPSSTS